MLSASSFSMAVIFMFPLQHVSPNFMAHFCISFLETENNVPVHLMGSVCCFQSVLIEEMEVMTGNRDNKKRKVKTTSLYLSYYAR